VANIKLAGRTAVSGSLCSHRGLLSVLSSALLMHLQATPYLAAALSKTDCRRCIQLQSKAVQSATDRWGLLRNLSRKHNSVGLKRNNVAAVLEVYCIAKAARPHKQQGKSVQPGLPDISELSPQLQQEWHPDNNALLGGIKLKPGSGRRVTWSCPNCPAGCPHI